MSPRTALVTGGGSGIGAAIASRLAADGYEVIVVGRRPQPLAEVCERIAAAGGRARPLSGDIGDPAGIEAIAAAVAAEPGRLELLVNNAGVARAKRFEDFTVADFDDVVAVNLRAPFLLTQALLPSLRAAASASVVNTSSATAEIHRPGNVLYSTTKAALDYLTRALAVTFAPEGIRVNSVAVGPVPTAMTTGGETGMGNAAANERMVRSVPLGRMGSAEEVARWVAHLAAEDASWTTGAVIAVDGGQRLGNLEPLVT